MAKQQRLRSEDARFAILEAAERRLIEGGPDAVRVQKVGRDLGISDAAIHYHFGNRRGLMEALLRHAGRNLKESLEAGASGWDTQSTDSAQAADFAQAAARIGDVYREKGYARLALWLALEGWESEGEGMYRALAERLQTARQGGADFDETRMAVALLNVFLVGEALTGEAFLASVGLPRDEAARARMRDLAVDLISERLGLVGRP